MMIVWGKCLADGRTLRYGEIVKIGKRVVVKTSDSYARVKEDSTASQFTGPYRLIYQEAKIYPDCVCVDNLSPQQVSK
jgi:hypothetical protein